LPLTGGIPQPLNSLKDCLIAVESAFILPHATIWKGK
jgi:hypothetical protein